MNPQNFTIPEVNIAALGVHEGMVVADFGAGTGAYTIPLAEKVGERGHVYAVEVQKEFLTNVKNNAAEKGFKNISVIWGDVERLGGTKIKNKTVDAVIVSNVLFQAEDKKGLIQEAKRILKTGGELLLVDWSGSFDNLGPIPKMVISENTARAMFEAEGFVFKKKLPAGDHHYGIVFYQPEL